MPPHESLATILLHIGYAATAVALLLLAISFLYHDRRD